MNMQITAATIMSDAGLSSASLEIADVGNGLSGNEHYIFLCCNMLLQVISN